MPKRNRHREKQKQQAAVLAHESQDFRTTGVVHYLTFEEAVQAGQWLTDPERSTPVVIISTAKTQKKPYVDASALAPQLKDVAPLWVLPDVRVNKGFTNSAPEAAKTTGGASRVIPCGTRWEGSSWWTYCVFAYNAQEGGKVVSKLRDKAIEFRAEALMGGTAGGSPGAPEQVNPWMSVGETARDGESRVIKLSGVALDISEQSREGGAQRVASTGDDVTLPSPRPSGADTENHVDDSVPADAPDDAPVVEMEDPPAVEPDDAPVVEMEDPPAVEPDDTPVRNVGDTAEATAGNLSTTDVAASDPDEFDPSVRWVVPESPPLSAWESAQAGQADDDIERLWGISTENISVPEVEDAPVAPVEDIPAVDAENTSVPEVEDAPVAPVEDIPAVDAENTSVPEVEDAPVAPVEDTPAAGAPTPAAMPRVSTGLTPVAVRAAEKERNEAIAYADRSQRELADVLAELEALQSGLREQKALAKDAEKRARAAEKERDEAIALSEGCGMFTDPVEQFRHEVYLSYLRVVRPEQRAEVPLPDYHVGPNFLDTVDRLEGIKRSKIVQVCMETVTGLADHSAGRGPHLNAHKGNPAPTRSDGAKSWRTSLQRGAGGRRLTFWRLADGTVEFSKVGVHDDYGA